MKYTAKLLPAKIEVRLAKWVLYKGEIYRHLPKQRREDKDPLIYTFIEQDNASRGYHEKWEDLIPLQMCLCSKDIKEGEKFWFAKTSAPFFEERTADTIKDGYVWPAGSAIRFNIHWIWKKEAIVDDFCSWVKQDDEFNEEDVKFHWQSDDRKVKYIEEGDPVFTQIDPGKNSFYEIEATVKEFQEDEAIEWWDVPVVLTNVRKQIGFKESKEETGYRYEDMPDITVQRRHIRYRPIRWAEANIKCPTCKRI